MPKFNLYDSNNVCNLINWDQLSLIELSKRGEFKRYYITDTNVIIVKSKKFYINFKDCTNLSNDLNIDNYDFKLPLSECNLDNKYFEYTQRMFGERIKETLYKSKHINIKNNIISYDKDSDPFFGGIFRCNNYTMIDYIKTDGYEIDISPHHKMLENLFDDVKLEVEFFYTPVIYSKDGYNIFKNEIIYLKLYQSLIQEDVLTDLFFLNF